MDDSRKKPIMIAVIIGCLALAGLIRYLTSGSSDSAGQYRGEMQLMKCRNPQCKAEFEMDKADYLSEVRRLKSGMDTPGVPCEKCGQNSAYAAIKCPKCGLVFEEGAAGPGKYVDKCPSCGYSELGAGR